jgi:hypothetical protein
MEPEARKVHLQFSFLSYEKTWVELFNPTKADIDISGTFVLFALEFSLINLIHSVRLGDYRQA